MYKIFIDSSDNDLIIKLSKEVEKSLLANDNCIVYRNNERETRYSVQDLDLDAYIYIKGDAIAPRTRNNFRGDEQGVKWAWKRDIQRN